MTLVTSHALEAPHLYTHCSIQDRLDLAHQQLSNHLLASDAHRRPQRGEVDGAEQAVREAEEQHGRDPAAGVLHGEAARLGHHVLLDVAAVHPVHAAGRVHLGLELARHERVLRARQDVEVVVGSVAPAVALGADGGAEDDEVLRDAWRSLAGLFRMESCETYWHG